MKRKDPLKNLKNQRRANKSSLMMDSLNETISSKTPSRRISADFLHYYKTAGHNNNPAILFYCIVSTSFPYLLR